MKIELNINNALKTFQEMKVGEFGIIQSDCNLNGCLVKRLTPDCVCQISNHYEGSDLCDSYWRQLHECGLKVRVLMPGESFTVTI